ncbi:MAG: hypothetical protein N2D54_00485, partial [Chloroflexota bacterium]
MEVQKEFSPPPAAQDLKLTINQAGSPIASAVLTADLSAASAENLTFVFDAPVSLALEENYSVILEMLTPNGAVTILGSAVAVESPWDDGLPLRVQGYDGYNGIYQPEMNFEMYQDANPAKLARMLMLLDKADYITISSSRQWASTTRIPERYPLVVDYYRHLLGCPIGETIEWCYNIADVGTFEGEFGFELVQVFQSDPILGDFRINDQFSEEAFTVYDHPKVFIFKKTAAYNHRIVTNYLSTVDLENVVRLTPMQASKRRSANLLLPSQQFETQKDSGTWAKLFDIDSLVNQSDVATVIAWYFALALLGWGAYPLVRKALPGLADGGYPLARTAGLLLLSYFSWLAGSLGLNYSREVIAVLYGLILVLGG